MCCRRPPVHPAPDSQFLDCAAATVDRSPDGRPAEPTTQYYSGHQLLLVSAACLDDVGSKGGVYTCGSVDADAAIATACSKAVCEALPGPPAERAAYQGGGTEPLWFSALLARESRCHVRRQHVPRLRLDAARWISGLGRLVSTAHCCLLIKTIIMTQYM